MIQIAAFKYIGITGSCFKQQLVLMSLSRSIAQEQWKKATWHFEGKSLYRMCE